MGVKSSDTGELPRVFGAWDLSLWCCCLGLFNLGCGLSWLMMTGPQVAVLLSVSSEEKMDADGGIQAKSHCAAVLLPLVRG